jgi:hypothetical protein
LSIPVAGGFDAMTFDEFVYANVCALYFDEFSKAPWNCRCEQLRIIVLVT